MATYPLWKQAKDEQPQATNAYDTAMAKAKASDTGKKYMSSISGGELLLDAAGAAAGGLLGYTLAHSMKWKKKGKWQAVLIGAGLGGVGTQALISNSDASKTLREAALLQSDTKEGQAVRDAVAAQEAKPGALRQAGDFVVENTPFGTFAAAGGLVGAYRSLNYARRIAAYNALKRQLNRGIPDQIYVQGTNKGLFKPLDWNSVGGLDASLKAGDYVRIPKVTGGYITAKVTSAPPGGSLGVVTTATWDPRTWFRPKSVLNIDRHSGDITVSPTIRGNIQYGLKNAGIGAGIGLLVDTLAAYGKSAYRRKLYK